MSNAGLIQDQWEALSAWELIDKIPHVAEAPAGYEPVPLEILRNAYRCLEMFELKED